MFLCRIRTLRTSFARADSVCSAPDRQLSSASFLISQCSAGQSTWRSFEPNKENLETKKLSYLIYLLHVVLWFLNKQTDDEPGHLDEQTNPARLAAPVACTPSAGQSADQRSFVFLGRSLQSGDGQLKVSSHSGLRHLSRAPIHETSSSLSG